MDTENFRNNNNNNNILNEGYRHKIKKLFFHRLATGGYCFTVMNSMSL